jgi:hypothetical protein
MMTKLKGALSGYPGQFWVLLFGQLVSSSGTAKHLVATPRRTAEEYHLEKGSTSCWKCASLAKSYGVQRPSLASAPSGRLIVCLSGSKQ